jgi:hypothetical protein
MSASHRDDVDTLIDGVAREMTGVAPRSDFAARVAARVAGADTFAVRGGRPSTLPFLWRLAPAAAAAVLLLAVFIVRETRGPARRGADVGPAAPVAPLRLEPARPAILLPSTPDATTVNGRTATDKIAPSRIMRAPAAAPLPDPGLPPLIVAPMAVDRIDVSPLARGDTIEISAIAIERIDITAMP